MTAEDRMNAARIDYLREQYRIAPRGHRQQAWKRLHDETTRQLKAAVLERDLMFASAAAQREAA